MTAARTSSASGLGLKKKQQGTRTLRTIATGELKIDEQQQGFIVDPSRTLEEVVAEYDARNAKRMAELEGGGLLTGRCLAEFARRHLPEDKQKIVEREGLTRKDAVRKVMEGK